MLPKASIEHIVAKQRKALYDMPTGHPREISGSLPYLSDRPLLIGGMRGSGRAMLLGRMLKDEYPEAWYTDFDDPRLAGFDESDFAKLDRLIRDSGKGILLLNKVDCAAGWLPFLSEKPAQGIKVIATVSLPSLLGVEQDMRSNRISGLFVTRRLEPLSYNEFLGFTHKKGSSQAVADYMARGALPEAVQASRPGTMLRLYDRIVCRDLIVAGGIRDRQTLQRVVLHLIASSGGTVTANNLRETLRIKAVSTAAEHMALAERAGLVAFVPILTDNPARQAINPRKVYAADTAMIAALSPEPQPDRDRLFETMIFNHLRRSCSLIRYTTEQGGCDFVATDSEGAIRCVQACREDDSDRMQDKIDGLLFALRATGLRKGTIVTETGSERILRDGLEIEVTDADAFLSETV